MAHTAANLNGVFNKALPLPAIRNLRRAETTRKKSTLDSFLSKKEEFEEALLKTTRRVVLGLSSIAAVFGNSGIGNSFAEDNGFWLTGPIPIPQVYNKIVNEETGTRSFLQQGIYIADIGTKGRTYRIRKYAFDLLALGDLIGKDAWNYVRKFLRLKSTFIYYDFDKVISAAPVNDKETLTDLANRLFDNVEKLEDAVKKHDLPQTESYYIYTTAILQEIMNKMA